MPAVLVAEAGAVLNLVAVYKPDLSPAIAMLPRYVHLSVTPFAPVALI